MFSKKKNSTQSLNEKSQILTRRLLKFLSFGCGNISFFKKISVFISVYFLFYFIFASNIHLILNYKYLKIMTTSIINICKTKTINIYKTKNTSHR